MSSAPRVLVADDTALVRWAVRRTLNAAGYRALEAETRSQVLGGLLSGSFCLVILPLVLAGDDMEDVACAIASAATNTALIVLTENGALPEALRSHARVRGMDKPFSVTSLVETAMALAPPGVEPRTNSTSP